MTTPYMPPWGPQGPQAPQQDTQGSPAYAELRRIWQQAMIFRRGGKYSKQQIQDWLIANLGPGSSIQPDMASVTAAMQGEANPAQNAQGQPMPNTGGAPMSGMEAAQGRAGELLNGALLNVPRAVSGAVDQALTQTEAQVPEARTLNTVGSLLPFSMISRIPGLLGRAGAAAGAGAIQALPPANQPADWATVAKSAVVAGALQGLPEAAIGKFQNIYRPAAHAAEEIAHRMEVSGGVERAHVLQAATPDVPLTLADVSPSARNEIFKVAPRFNPEVKGVLIQKAQELLHEAQQAADRMSQQYNRVLSVPLQNPVVVAITERPAVKALLKDLIDEGMPIGNDFTARNLQDLRLAIRQQATDLGQSLQKGAGGSNAGARARYNALRAAEQDLHAELQKIPGFSTVEAKYGPYAQLVTSRRGFLLDLQRRQRAMALAQPKGLHGVIAHEAGTESQQIMYRRGGQLAKEGLLLPWQRALQALHGSPLWRMSHLPFGAAGFPTARPDASNMQE